MAMTKAVCVRLCLKEILCGQLDLRAWRAEARQVPAALLVDCRGVHDALARSSSSCFAVKDKTSGSEGARTGVIMRHSWVALSPKIQMLRVLVGSCWYFADSDGSWEHHGNSILDLAGWLPCYLTLRVDSPYETGHMNLERASRAAVKTLDS